MSERAGMRDVEWQGGCEATGAYLDAFFIALVRAGVKNAVVSPGSRSTSLVMKAYEHIENVYVDVDERGAAFLALGLAKESGVPTVVICTSGTAVANWYPAVCEANVSRVPLIFLSGDRPARLQGVGAPQAMNQRNVFGHYARFFQTDELGQHNRALTEDVVRFACDIYWASGRIPHECHDENKEYEVTKKRPGPVHVNVPCEEPLKPAMKNGNVVSLAHRAYDAYVQDYRHRVDQGEKTRTHNAGAVMGENALFPLDPHIRKPIIIAGDGTTHFSGNTVAAAHELRDIMDFAAHYQIPVIADPLSGLRGWKGQGSELIISNYDSFFMRDNEPEYDAVIRFGRFPVSKRCASSVEKKAPLHIVIDPWEHRDYTATYTHHIKTTPAFFSRHMLDNSIALTAGFDEGHLAAWQECDKCTAQIIHHSPTIEGEYMQNLLSFHEDNFTIVVANSMSIRTLDTFWDGKEHLNVIGNRGLNGIDGTLSTAFGVALVEGAATFITGDLAFMHDMNSLALAEEFVRAKKNVSMPIICFNNSGGAIFNILPQRSDNPLYERLFLTPHSIDFSSVARAFHLPYRRVGSVDEFSSVYCDALRNGGVQIIEILVPIDDVAERYGHAWGANG
ncbi:MAG: 2-succinyl-5-enolpyruvyl-6-hydroxy-3-cyclohexene-1-carboxylic-acid synthase [Actinomycetaceae bacterium]|nr:2-succinyl-5-enolpyruvyl-6-hydroxy-3-cyclohexene-1-carboxylic-acid synthase [Actinomycetaceae bacterium]